MEKLFQSTQSTTRGAKASEYKQNKAEDQQKKTKEVADAKAKDKDKGKGSGKDSNHGPPKKCYGCGNPQRTWQNTVLHALPRTRSAAGAKPKDARPHTAHARAKDPRRPGPLGTPRRL